MLPLPEIVRAEADGEPVRLRQIYAAGERDRPDLVDDEIEPTPIERSSFAARTSVRIETLVVTGGLLRRKAWTRSLLRFVAWDPTGNAEVDQRSMLGLECPKQCVAKLKIGKCPAVYRCQRDGWRGVLPTFDVTRP